MAVLVETLTAEVRKESGLRNNQLFTDSDIEEVMSDAHQELQDLIMEANEYHIVKTFDFTLAGGDGGNSVTLPTDFIRDQTMTKDYGTSRAQPVLGLAAWAQRDSCVDRRFIPVGGELFVFPSRLAAGDYRLFYVGAAEKLSETDERTVTYSDPTPFPSDLKIWLDPEIDLVPDGTGNAVLTWTDRENGIVFSREPFQGVAPAFYLDDHLGLNAIGNLSLHQGIYNPLGGAMAGGQTAHFFVVCQPPSNYGASVFQFGGANPCMIVGGRLRATDSKNIIFYEEGADPAHAWEWTDPTPFDGTSYYLLEWTVTVSPPIQITFRVNGVLQTVAQVAACAFPSSAGQIRVGDVTNVVNVEQQFGGKIGEAIVYQPILDAASRLQTATYLMERWGIS